MDKWQYLHQNIYPIVYLITFLPGRTVEKQKKKKKKKQTKHVHIISLSYATTCGIVFWFA